MAVKEKRTEYREALKIDRDALDDCLVEQPELFYHVSENYVVAVSERDGAKLDLEEAIAEEDQKVRATQSNKDKKDRMTEGAIYNSIITMPRIKKLNDAFLSSKTEADLWGALEKAYSQRLSALRELVALRMKELYSIAMKSGAADARGTLRDAAASAAQTLRRNAVRSRRHEH